MQPMISVVMPIYNTPEEYLKCCIDSVIAQEFNNIELICVDNGSDKKHVVDVLDKYKTSNIPCSFNIIRLEKNVGAAEARNIGINASKGKYLICLDSDDYFFPGFLKKLYTLAEKENSQVCFCGHNDCNSELTDILSEYNPDKKRANKGSEEFLLSIASCPWSKLVRRDFLVNKKIRFQSLSSCNDVYYTAMIMLLAKKISIVEERLVNWRSGHSTQITANGDSMNLWYACEKIKNDIKNTKEYCPEYDVMIDGLLMGIAPYALRRCNNEQSKKDFYTTIKHYFSKSEFDFSTPGLSYLRRQLIENNYDSKWFELVGDYKKQLQINSLDIKKHIENKKILVWGLGDRGKAFLSWADENGVKVEYIYDKNSNKAKMFSDKSKVITEVDFLDNNEYVIILSSNYTVYEYVTEKYGRFETLCIQKWCEI